MLLNEEDIGQSDDKVGTVGALAVGTGHGWAPLEASTQSGYVLTVTPGAKTNPFDPNLPPVTIGLAWGPGGGGGMTVGNAVTGGSNNAVLVESGTGTLAAIAIGSTGQVMTVASGAPAWATPVTATTISAALASAYTVTTTPANTGLQIILPTAGTYMIGGLARGSINMSGVAGNWSQMAIQLNDITNSLVVPNSLTFVVIAWMQASTSTFWQQSCPLGPLFYTPTVAPATIQLWASYALASGTILGATIATDASGGTYLSA